MSFICLCRGGLEKQHVYKQKRSKSQKQVDMELYAPTWINFDPWIIIFISSFNDELILWIISEFQKMLDS